MRIERTGDGRFQVAIGSRVAGVYDSVEAALLTGLNEAMFELKRLEALIKNNIDAEGRRYREIERRLEDLSEPGEEIRRLQRRREAAQIDSVSASHADRRTCLPPGGPAQVVEGEGGKA